MPGYVRQRQNRVLTSLGRSRCVLQSLSHAFYFLNGILLRIVPPPTHEFHHHFRTSHGPSPLASVQDRITAAAKQSKHLAHNPPAAHTMACLVPCKAWYVADTSACRYTSEPLACHACRGPPRTGASHSPCRRQGSRPARPARSVKSPSICCRHVGAPSHPHRPQATNPRR